MGTAAEIITARVRDRVREEFGEPGRRGGAGRIAREEVRRYNERALNDTTPLIDDEHGMTSEVLAAVTGFGAIQPLLDDLLRAELRAGLRAESRVEVAELDRRADA